MNAMLIPFKKPSISLSQQISQLEQKGMLFEDKSVAKKHLENLGYYRLSGYWFPYKNHKENKFLKGTRFTQIISLYESDCKLRMLILSSISSIEIAMRARFTFHLGQKYGPFGYIDANNFNEGFAHNKWLASIQREVERSKDTFIIHFKNKYKDYPNVPIWMLTEVMSLGSLSIGYRGLRNNKPKGIEDKREIAQHFNIHHKELEKWLHILTYVRNICAHHGRLWNRTLAIQPASTKKAHWNPPTTPRKDKIFYVLLIINQLLKQVNDNNNWLNEITLLLQELIDNDSLKREAMGLPIHWQKHPLLR